MADIPRGRCALRRTRGRGRFVCAVEPQEVEAAARSERHRRVVAAAAQAREAAPETGPEPVRQWEHRGAKLREAGPFLFALFSFPHRVSHPRQLLILIRSYIGSYVSLYSHSHLLLFAQARRWTERGTCGSEVDETWSLRAPWIRDHISPRRELSKLHQKGAMWPTFGDANQPTSRPWPCPV